MQNPLTIRNIRGYTWLDKQRICLLIKQIIGCRAAQQLANNTSSGVSEAAHGLSSTAFACQQGRKLRLCIHSGRTTAACSPCTRQMLLLTKTKWMMKYSSIDHRAALSSPAVSLLLLFIEIEKGAS
eukprot:scaffold322264_cov15-Tisochrysis_lutea.AAC.1